MELQYFGGNCVKLITKKATVTVDDTLSELGAKSVTKAGDISLFTGAHGLPAVESKIVIDEPGEYEVSDISVQGVAARAHIDEEGTSNATIYKVIVDDVRVAVIGHVYPALSSAQLEALGTIDVLVIPVGGNGYTVDPIGALKLVKDIEPKLVIPTHYDDKSLKYPVPQQPLEEAIKALAMEPRETVAKLKVKAGELGDLTQLVILERQ
jgi:L-ascorbate metabolism protein UlaG (beta-lactamase superfamily)